MSTGRWTFLLLALIIVLGAALRFYGLAEQSLSGDEMRTWGIATQPHHFFVTVRQWDNNPPGYHLLMRLVISICGDSETCLRLPSAVFGVAALIALFFLGRRLYSSREGLVAASLMAVFYPPIFFSQLVRPYSLLLLMTIVLAYFTVALDRAFRARTRPPLVLLAAFTLCATSEAYLHFSGAFFVLLVGVGFVCFFFRDRRALAYIAGMYGVISLAYAPWISSALRQLRNPTMPGSPEPGAFLHYLQFLLGDSPLMFFAAIAMGAYLAGTALLPAIKNFRSTAKTILSSPGFLLFLWLIIPFIALYVKSQVSFPLFFFRYLAISFPAAYLLFARALVRLPFPARANYGVAVVLTMFAAYHLIAVQKYYTTPVHPQWREAVAAVRSWAAGDRQNRAVIIKVHSWPWFADYYFAKSSLVGDPRFTLLGQWDAVVQTLDKQKPEYVWWLDTDFFTFRPREQDYVQSVDRYLRRLYAGTDFLPLHGVNLRLFRRR